MTNISRDSKATRQIEVAICGNPNCGKTTIFNAITGLRQRVGNYPGVTVDKIYGQFKIEGHEDKTFNLADIPGSYSLSAFSPDEYIAARALFGCVDGGCRPDVIACIIDSTNLERGLYLLFQVLQIGLPVVVGLNMIDLSEKHGTKIDFRKLSEELGGIPVVPMVGSRGKGIAELKQEIGKLAASRTRSTIDVNDPVVAKVVTDFEESVDNGHRTRAEYFRVLFDVNGPAESDFIKDTGETHRPTLERSRKQLVDHFGSLTVAETSPYTKRASEINQAVVAGERRPEKSYSNKIDKVLLNPFFGPIILVAVMTLIFQSIFSWAEPIMDLVDTTFGALAGLVAANMAPGPLQSLITNGVIGGVGSVLIFLPQIMILFLFISLLEDSGYMPRAAFLVDRAFAWCGLSGKSFIPMLSSFACAIPGIMATRTIEDRKLRLITIMVAPLMSCSARLPVYAIMIAAFIPHKTYLGIFNSQGLVLTGLYILGIITAIIVSWILKKTILKAERGTFIMDMPSYKVPSFSSVGIRVMNRAKSFVLRAGTIILAITIIIWALGYYPRSTEVTAEYDNLRAEVAAEFESSRAAVTSGISEQFGSIPEATAVITASEAQFETVESEEALTTATTGLIADYPSQIDLINLLASRQQLVIDERARISELANQEEGAYVRDSYFARMGRTIEPVFRPLGWDWKITMSVIASFPAREVIIATLGTIFNLGADVDESSLSLVEKMRNAKWDDGPMIGQDLFTPAVAISIMVFFALSCQCGATVVTIRQEAGSWFYSVFVFVYMTSLAYLGSLASYQLFRWMGF